MLYMALTHWASVRFRLRAEIIVGRATPTIVPSKMMRESPAARMARAFQRPGKGWAAVAAELASDTAFLSTCRHYEGDGPSASTKRLKTSPTFSPSERRQWYLLASYS